MQVFSKIELLSEVCKLTNKYGMMFSHSREEWDHKDMDYYCKVLKALPFVSQLIYYQSIIDGVGFILFDTEEEMLSKFNGVVRSPELPRIYTITCYPDGNLGDERKR